MGNTDLSLFPVKTKLGKAVTLPGTWKIPRGRLFLGWLGPPLVRPNQQMSAKSYRGIKVRGFVGAQEGEEGGKESAVAAWNIYCKITE